MKKIFFTGLLCSVLVHLQVSAQKMLQEVIIDYVNLVPPNVVNKVLAKNTPVKVSLLKGTTTSFYRISVFQPEKVNTSSRLYETLRLVNPDTLTKADYSFDKHSLASNANFKVAVGVFTDAKSAQQFIDGKETSPCFKIDSTQNSVGKLEGCRGDEVYIAVKPLGKRKLGSIKVEVVSLADVIEDPVNDRFPFSLQNELNGEVAYEVSGDRLNWQAFFLPSKKRAEFKLADTQVYMRVSTLDKVTEEYKIDSGKKYRLFWNKDKNRVDVSEIPVSK
ncbi:hypothetical protein [Runella sp. SP2]|uniref:hypothetical protein n=1 Tax=Runella sp. SP2 TaxID=2268026 RepID=UPI000F097B8D|nr:hypothetical protein [Runella sp. SP2]AYQ31584.1 hypothetical protein DTQ70_05065 [Runella sp. SP2]